MPFSGMMCPEMRIMLVYRLILESPGFWLIRTCTVHPVVYILFCHFCFSIFVSLFFVFFFLRFYGYIFYKPSRDLTRPLRETKGFKGLVAYAKYNRDSYESELGS